MSKFCTNVNNSFTRSSYFIIAPIWKLRFLYGSMPTLIKSLALSACWPSVGSYNCYGRSYSVNSFYLISRLIAATKYYLATDWSPLTMTTPWLAWNFTFTCKVDRIAPMAWIQCLPRIFVHEEKDSTTMKFTITSFPSIFKKEKFAPLESPFCHQILLGGIILREVLRLQS